MVIHLLRARSATVHPPRPVSRIIITQAPCPFTPPTSPSPAHRTAIVPASRGHLCAALTLGMFVAPAMGSSTPRSDPRQVRPRQTCATCARARAHTKPRNADRTRPGRTPGCCAFRTEPACPRRSPACAVAAACCGRFPTTVPTSPARSSPTTPASAGRRPTGSSCSGTSSGRSAWTPQKRGRTSPPTGHPGGRGVIVAVLDTGVAYANRGRFRRSPDFSPYEFVKGYDFIAHNPYPNDHNGHGTFVAGDDRRVDQQPLRPHRPRLRRAPDARARAQQPGRRRRLDDRRRRALRRQPPRAGDQPIASSSAAKSPPRTSPS